MRCHAFAPDNLKLELQTPPYLRPGALGFPGIILGPFLGALLFDMAAGRDFKPAARAGLGALLGLLAGAVGKLAIRIAMIGLFTVNVIWRSLG